MDERAAFIASTARGGPASLTGTDEDHPAGREPAWDLMTWLYREPQMRILADANGEVLWMSLAAKALPANTYPFSDTQNGEITPRRRLHARLVAQFTLLDDDQAHCLTSPAAPEWVAWAQVTGAAGEHGARVGLILRRQGETPQLDALGQVCGLTRAEIKIIAALMAGQDTATVARNLGISMHTLRTHVRHAYRKLGVTTREGLFAGALAFMRP